MKKILILVLLVLFCSGSVFGGEFEDTLKKAEQGNIEAQYSLGNKYTNGQGVPQDYKQAVYWYTKAAEQGYADAQYNLGYMYANGQGVPQNFKLAYVWDSLAAEQGNQTAIKNRNEDVKKLSAHELSEAHSIINNIRYKIKKVAE